MKIGDYKLYSIQTGLFRLDGGAMFGVVPKPLWSITNPSDDKNRIDMCMRCLLLVSDKKKILIDNGVGYKYSPKFKDIYGIDHSTFTLDNSLKSLGFTTDDITDVILTHLHFDHCGGSTYREDGKLKLSFSNAEHHVQKNQWERGNNPTDRDKASYILDNFRLIHEIGHLNLVNGDTQFDDYIQLLVINGHTPGQQMIKIKDDNNTLLYAGDLIPMASHIPLPYIMGYDLLPLTTLDEKKKYLPQAVKEDWIIFIEHDPFIETCRVEENIKGFNSYDKKLLNER
jgi:glyoxylase-like metal-dependent hydrolase (beta-lactamase superfamily II)